MADSTIAFTGASDTDSRLFGDEDERRDREPMVPKMLGSQVLFAAATAILPATNELPRREPATTRQIKVAERIPNALPRRRVMAV
jgi:hypothetical protein